MAIIFFFMTLTASIAIRSLVPTGDTGVPVAIEDVPAPEPAPGEVLIAVEASSINRGETRTVNEPPVPGYRPGQDVAGRVIEAAVDGDGTPLGPPVGAAVVAHAAEGAWATEVAVPATSVAELPESVSFEQAATLPIAGLGALRLLRRAGSVAGCRVLLTGASGGLGHFATELATGQGARVTAVSSSPQRGERLLALGAEDVVTAVGEAEGPYDLVLESVGGATLAKALELASPDATVLWYGQVSREPAQLDFFAVAASLARIVPFLYWRTGASDAEDLATLVRLVERGHLHPEIGRVDDWERAAEAVVAVRERQVRGKAVLKIAG